LKTSSQAEIHEPIYGCDKACAAEYHELLIRCHILKADD